MQKIHFGQRLLACVALIVSGLCMSMPATAGICETIEDTTRWDTVMFKFSVGGDHRYGPQPQRLYNYIPQGDVFTSLNGKIKIRALTENTVMYYLGPDSATSSLRIYGAVKRVPKDTIYKDNGKYTIVYDTVSRTEGAIRIEAPVGYKIRRIRYTRLTLDFIKKIEPATSTSRTIYNDHTLQWSGCSDTVRMSCEKYGDNYSIGTMWVWYEKDESAVDVPDLEVNVSDVKYATVYDSVARVVPEGLTASVVSTINDENNQRIAVLNDLYPAGSVIPANTGVVVNGDPATYVFTAGHDYLAEAAESNLLQGTADTAMTTGDGHFFGLSYSGDDYSTVGFYWMADGGAAYLNPAHRAYLVLPTDSNIRAVYFNEQPTTGLAEVETVEKSGDNRIYDLQGCRLNKMQKGVNIVNGKKIIR